MSLDCLTLVWKHSKSCLGSRLVLLALADYADEHRTSWPSIKNLSIKSNLSERNAQRSLQKLQDLGEIKIEPNSGPNGVNKYQILITTSWGDKTNRVTNCQGDKLVSKGCQIEHRGVTKRAKNVSDLSPNPSVPITNHNEPSVEITPEMIYDAYPKKAARPHALKAIKSALKKISSEVLLAKVQEFSKTRNGDLEFCEHPATWFNRERYNDDCSTWNNSHKPSHSKPLNPIGML